MILIKTNKELISLKQSLIDKDNIIYDLNAKIVKLEAQLHKDASNSSIPSSKDDNHKIIPNSRVRTGLKLGGQLDHIGHKRRKYVPDETVILPVDVNPKCLCTHLRPDDASQTEFSTDFSNLITSYHPIINATYMNFPSDWAKHI